MIVNLKRKVGLATGTQTPVPQHHMHPPLTAADLAHSTSSMSFDGGYHNGAGGHPGHAVGNSTAAALPPITLEDLDFSWPSDLMFSPTTIPQWLQEGVSQLYVLAFSALPLTANTRWITLSEPPGSQSPHKRVRRDIPPSWSEPLAPISSLVITNPLKTVLDRSILENLHLFARLLVFLQLYHLSATV